MQKRGQITLFVIIAIVIVLSITSFYYFTKDTESIESAEGQNLLSNYLSESKEIMYSCLETSAKDSTYYVLAHGGSLDENNSVNFPELGLIHKGFDTTINKATFPQINKIQEQISQHIQQKFLSCFNLTEFPKGTIIPSTQPKITTQIANNEITFRLEYPLTFTLGESSIRYNEPVIVSIPVSLTNILKTANDLTKTIETDPEYLDLEFIQKALTEIVVLPLDENNILFMLTDYNQTIENIPITIFFVMG